MQPHQSANATGPANRAGEVLRHLRLAMTDELAENSFSNGPIKTGMKREGLKRPQSKDPRFDEAMSSAADRRGKREAYILTRGEETPVLPANPDSSEEAVLVFSTRELAELYLQVARWEDHTVTPLAPIELSQWLLQAREQGINAVLIDANRHDQERGIEPPVRVVLDQLHDFSGENLHHELFAVSKP